MRETVDASIIREAALRLFAENGYRATTMADIGAALGIRGPSLYKHVSSKQTLLVDIMLGTMGELIDDQHAAVSAGGTPSVRLRRMVEAHVRFHTAHRHEAFVGNREIGSLVPGNRVQVLALRARYERALRALIEEGCATGEFVVQSPRLASYAILDMGMGVSAWFRPDAEYTSEKVAYFHADLALRMVGAGG